MLEVKERHRSTFTHNTNILKKKRKLKKNILFYNKKKQLKMPVSLKKEKKRKMLFLPFNIHNFTLSFSIVSRGYQVAFKYCSVVSSYYHTLSLFFKICMFRIVFSQKHFDHEKSACR